MVVVEKEATLKQDAIEEEPTVVLYNLSRVEGTLMDKKKKMIALRKKQKLTVQKEIKSKKSDIQKFRAEITDLKFDCDKLSKSLQTGENSLI